MMFSSLVDEDLEALPPRLDELVLVDAVVVAERQLHLQRLARQGGHHYLQTQANIFSETL